jgi:hypothetical protein
LIFMEMPNQRFMCAATGRPTHKPLRALLTA